MKPTLACFLAITLLPLLRLIRADDAAPLLNNKPGKVISEPDLSRDRSARNGP